MGQDQLFLGREMQVDRAFADADLPGHVLHGHLAVSIGGQQAVDGVENEVFDILSLGNFPHIMTLTIIVFRSFSHVKRLRTDFRRRAEAGPLRTLSRRPRASSRRTHPASPVDRPTSGPSRPAATPVPAFARLEFSPLWTMIRCRGNRDVRASSDALITTHPIGANQWP
ncbi:MAG: hypothetical protein MZV64_68005 [Ignavibacteriales bacterium]|nr:hypothetical protein [Ignavibacteriales bacterium]